MSSAPATRGDRFPSIDIDLYRPEIWADPWPLLRRIREAGPLVWNEQGYWMAARDRTCRQIMNMPGSVGMDGVISTLFGADAFIAMDDKASHNVLRNVWAPSFGRDGAARLVAMVRRLAGSMLDAVDERLRAGEPVDLMAALCRPLPAYVIANMLGVPDDMISSVIRWSDAMAEATAGGYPIDFENDPHWLASEAAKAELAEFLFGQIAYRRLSPGDDLISRIVHSEVGRAMSDEAIMNNARQLIFAGNETTAKWLGHVLVALLDDGSLRDEVRGDRALLSPLIEEVMRWQGVTHATPRTVTRSGVVIEGIELPVGDEVVLLLGAAGRDPERFPDPDRFDIHRAPRPHVGFGFGMHSCIGAILARMEVKQVASVLLDRNADFRRAGPVHYSGFSLRGPLTVPIALSRRTH